MTKTVYVRGADDIDEAHFAANVAAARKYGAVVVGLITDEAFWRSGRAPRLDFEARRRIVDRIEGVAQILSQNDYDGLATLRRLQPDYCLCDLNADTGADAGRLLALAGEWAGQLITLEGVRGDPEPRQVLDFEFGVTPSMRLRQLRRLLAHSGFVRALEVHSPLCGAIVEKAEVQRQGRSMGFDAMWSSSLTDSTVRGKPDIEVVDHSARLAGLNELFDVTSKPLLYDADTGGLAEHFGYTVRSLERLGVSAVVIEDKAGLKRNSLLGGDSRQTRESIDDFSYKIAAGKAAQTTRDFAVIARIESFILNAGLEDALERAKAYVEAGADGVLIHSRASDPDEIFAFCDRFRKVDASSALVVVPTSYGDVYESELRARGVNVVIYANHLLRASYPAMLRAAQTILEHGRCREADAHCMPMEEVFRLAPGPERR
ncbi:phosphoenolpyruvate mutase [Caulobacter sp. LjRoot300]|uniref:phosphoenolpyruvate mutase n=1 Tax=Caulobacter sp. LjRoot300 TaxID=3342321 RepID=UPI003ECC58C1